MTTIIPKLVEKGVTLFWDNELKRQREIRKLPHTKIKQIQWKKLKALLEYVYENNTFYKKYFRSVQLTPKDIIQPEDLLQLPLTDKRTYRKHFNEIVSNGVNLQNHILSCTSGSSGEPFQFYNQTKMVKILYFSYLLNRESMGIEPFQKINELVIKPYPINEIDLNTLKPINKRKIKSIKELILTNKIGLRCNVIQSKNYNQIFQLMVKYNIQGIYGYSRSLFDLAEYFNKNQKEVSLKYIICIGQGLTPQQKRIISDTFNSPVYMDYGASECPRMGFECTLHTGYHMDIYNYYFEYLKNNHYAKNNETGEIIVTNLNNYIFPFIRYKIGDRAEYTNQLCPCGINLPIVKNIEGRIHASIITPTGKEIPNGFFSVYFEYLSELIYRYQVIQTKKDEITIKIIPAKHITEEKINEIKNWVRNISDHTMKINIEITDIIIEFKSGKKLDLITYEQYKKIMNDN